MLIRGQNISKLIGTMRFSELLLFSVLDAAPSSAQVKIVDAVLIIALEAGLTPSSAATRVQPPIVSAAGAIAAALGEADIQANQSGPFAVAALAAGLATQIATTKQCQPVTEAHDVVAR